MKDENITKDSLTGRLPDLQQQIGALEQLKETKEFLESVIQSSMDGIVISDEQGCILSINTAAERIYGLSKEEMVGKHTASLVIEDKDLKETIRDKMGELFEKGFTSYEARHITKDGSYIDVECNCSLIKDEKGDYIAGVSIIRDISERKRMEQQLLQAEKLRSLGELAGGVAHDFNNMLASILGRVQLLRGIIDKPKVEDERRKSLQELRGGLDIIEKASMDGAETVRSIQEFAREKDDNKYFTEIDVNKTIEDAIEFTKARWKSEAEAKGIKIDIQKKFSTVFLITGSAAELREVVANIINNAVDAMPGGGTISIITFIEDNKVVIKIKDTGVGIPESIKERIFDPFFTTKGVHSTGLGMSVAYTIINRHKGSIAVDSTENEGTIFTIKLPVFDNTDSKEEIKPVKKVTEKANILVIDDDDSVRELLFDILTGGGHDVQAASDGNDGLAKFKENEFDMVFTDLGMPGMSGWQVAEEIKKINNVTPIALITGWEVQVEKSELAKREVDLVVNKPFRVDQILMVVSKGIEIRERIKSKMSEVT
jgi:PAS domain S-box-containing protein